MRIRPLLLATFLVSALACRSTDEPRSTTPAEGEVAAEEPAADSAPSVAAAEESQDPLAGSEQADRRAEARAAAEGLVREGDAHAREAAYGRAAESYRRAQNVIGMYPELGSGELAPESIEARLASVSSLAQDEDDIEGERLRQDAERVRLERDAEQRKYREDRLRTLYAQANTAFQREQYGVAEALAEQILLHDPGNETAIELRDIAQSARHQKRRAESRRVYRQSWLDTFQELETMGVAQSEVLVFDDLERWRTVSQRSPTAFRADTFESGDKEAVLARLEEIRVPVRFGEDGEGAPLEEIRSYLQSVTGINFVISAKVSDELDEDETSVYLELPDRSVRQLLDIITEVRENLRWKVEDGIVKFVTAEETTGGQVLRMYEVRDLIRPVTDFPGREINVIPQGGLPEPDEDVEEREALVITQDSLDALIRDNIATASWDADPGNSLRISNGTLVVSQTPEVHEQIQAMLDDLREATGIMVDIQARFLKVEDNFLEDIGVDFRGLGSPGLGTNDFFNDFGNPAAQETLGQDVGTDTDLGAFYDDGNDGDVRGRVENLFDNFLGDEDVLTGSGGLAFQWTYLNDLQLEMVLRAVAKSERVELVTAPKVLVSNTARSNLTVMNQVAYVQDYQVELAQSASIADPVVQVVEDGVVLDVRPVVSADRRFITLELRPTVAELQRPIATFSTSLGVSQNTVTIQLPELEISRVRTSVPMPDGGTVLLGGFKVHESQDYRSGVPILNKVPLLSFFFERKGTFISNRKLLILLKATIVINEEREPTPAQMGAESDLSSAPL